MDKKKKKTKKSFNKKELIVKLITIVSIIVVITVVYNFINNLDTINVKVEEHEFYKYFAGEKIEYNGSLKMTRKDDITELITEDGSIILDSTPIYYKDVQDKVLLPKTMAIAFPFDNGNIYKLNSLSTVYIDYGTVYIEKGNLKKELLDTFLYDGDSLYFFIDRTTLIVNDVEYDLSPLSYVNATYGGFTEIYNAQADEYHYIDIVNDDVIAKTSNYTINLTRDSMQYGETEQLLLRKIRQLDNLK